jgi:RND family efflux transporter MFP subunit
VDNGRLRPGLLVSLILVAALQGCSKQSESDAQQPTRGLRAYKVSTSAQARVRRFPSVLQPADVSPLAFEISGQLKAISLEVGQKVQLGDLLAEIDPRSLQAQVEQATSGVEQAQAQLVNAEADFRRQDELLKKQVTTQAAFDRAQAGLLSTRAQRDQAQRQLELATHNLERSKLIAPFAGKIARIDVKSFAQITAGQPILTLFSDDRFETSFLAPASVFQSMKIGQPVDVKVADMPQLQLRGRIKELGSQALQVSAFPVVIRLDNNEAGLNAGMAVEVAVEEPLLGADGGFLVPLSVLVPEGGKDMQRTAIVFVYDAATSTVRRRKIAVGGIRDNQLVVTDGLSAGEIVASAGVSYLVEGQKVKLLPFQEKAPWTF